MNNFKITKKDQIKNDHSSKIGFLVFILAMTFAGTSILVGKILSSNVSVFLTSFFSLLFAFLFMLPLQFLKIKELMSLKINDLKYMIFQALFGIVLFRVFTLYGLKFTSAVHAGIITSTTPAIMAVLSFILLKEKLGKFKILGIVFTVLGITIVNLHDFNGIIKGSQYLGNLLIFLAVVFESLLTIFRKYSKGKISSITNTTVLIIISLIFLLPFAIKDLCGFSVTTFGFKELVSLLYYGIFATSIAYILWGDGAVRISANRTGIAMAMLPISTLFFSFFILHEKLTYIHIIGCFLAVAGIILGYQGKD